MKVKKHRRKYRPRKNEEKGGGGKKRGETIGLGKLGGRKKGGGGELFRCRIDGVIIITRALVGW